MTKILIIGLLIFNLIGGLAMSETIIMELVERKKSGEYIYKFTYPDGKTDITITPTPLLTPYIAFPQLKDNLFVVSEQKEITK